MWSLTAPLRSVALPEWRPRRTPVLTAHGVALLTLGVLATSSMMAPWLAPYDPASPQDIVHLALRSPSTQHWLGTDSASRDLLSRLLFGARTSLTIACVGTATALGVGLAWAGAVRSAGAALSGCLLSLADIVRSVPRLLILLAVGAAVGGAIAPVTMAIAMGFVAAPVVCRVIDAQLQQLQTRPWNEAAHALGVPRVRAFSHHLLPHLLPGLLALMVVLLGEFLAAEAALGVLGLGIPEPGISWGRMIQDALPDLARAWWPLAVPCFALLGTMLTTATIADHLNERLVSHE